MATINYESDIWVQCPTCGNDLGHYLSIVHGTTLHLSDTGLEIQQISGDTDDDEIVNNYQSLLSVRCLKCNKVFSIDVESSEGNVYSFRDFKNPVFPKVVFSAVGRPQIVVVGGSRFQVEEVFTYIPLFHSEDDLLFGRPPYGTWKIRIEGVGCCNLTISYATGRDMRTILGDKLYIGIYKGDSFANERFSKVAKTGFLGSYIHDLPNVFLVNALFGAIIELESFVRTTAWTLLEEVYGSSSANWWTGNLPGQLAIEIKRRAALAGDPAFARHRPEEFITVGELRDLIDRKWDSVFVKRFGKKDRLLAALSRFEDFRNPVAHGRTITYDEYRKALDAIVDVRRLFQISEE